MYTLVLSLCQHQPFSELTTNPLHTSTHNVFGVIMVTTPTGLDANLDLKKHQTAIKHAVRPPFNTVCYGDDYIRPKVFDSSRKVLSCKYVKLPSD